MILKCPSRACDYRIRMTCSAFIDRTMFCPKCTGIFTFWNMIEASCRDIIPGGCSNRFTIPTENPKFGIRCPTCRRQASVDLNRLQLSLDPVVLRFPDPDNRSRERLLDDILMGCNLPAFEGMEREARDGKTALAAVPPGKNVLLCHYVKHEEVPRLLYGQCNFKIQSNLPDTHKFLGTLAAWITQGYLGLLVNKFAIEEIRVRGAELKQAFSELQPLAKFANKVVFLAE